MNIFGSGPSPKSWQEQYKRYIEQKMDRIYSQYREKELNTTFRDGDGQPVTLLPANPTLADVKRVIENLAKGITTGNWPNPNGERALARNIELLARLWRKLV